MWAATKRNLGRYVTWNGKPFNEDSDKIDHMYIASGKTRAYALYPSIDVIRKSSVMVVDDSTSSSGTILVKDTSARAELEVTANRISAITALGKNEERETGDKALLEVKDSVLVIRPIIISNTHKFDGTYISTKLFLPDSSAVILNYPQ